MKLISRLLFLLFIFLPIIARADIKITNDTDNYITAYLQSNKASPCSSKANQKGIVKPHSSLNVSMVVIGTYCGFTDCTAHVFMNDNCNTPEVAKATVNSFSGISSISNEDTTHYDISGSAYTVTVKPIKHQQKNWFSWFLS